MIEYKLIAFRFNNLIKEQEKTFNKLGKDGWIYKDCYPYDNGTICIFARMDNKKEPNWDGFISGDR